MLSLQSDCHFKARAMDFYRKLEWEVAQWKNVGSNAWPFTSLNDTLEACTTFMMDASHRLFETSFLKRGLKLICKLIHLAGRDHAVERGK
jgi:hypothetical protein